MFRTTLKTRAGRALQRVFQQSRPSAVLCSLVVFVLLGYIFISLPISAQVGTADILGTITDPTGAVLENAAVTVKNLGTAETRQITTNNRGDYVVNALSNGNYTVQVQVQGFRTFTANLTLSMGQRARVDAQLKTGAVSEHVEVSASDVAALQTDSSEVASTIDEKSVEDLPLNGCNYSTAILLQPGITLGNIGATNGGSHSGSEDPRSSFLMAANGQEDWMNNQQIDGFDNNERSMGVVALRPSVDGIAEMKVDTSSYRAENGRTAGAVVNIITKSGDNTFHGSLFEFLRNNIFDARDYFATTKATTHQNEYGGSIGGPIIKNKTFFFFDIEFNKNNSTATTSDTVPTLAERTSVLDYGVMDFTDVGDTTDYTGVAIDPLMLKLFQYYPTPTNSLVSKNYVVNTPGTNEGHTLDARVDHRFTANNLFFARYGYNPFKTTSSHVFPKDATTGLQLDNGGTKSTVTAQNVQIDYVHIFNSRLLMDLKAGFTRMSIEQLPSSYGIRASETLGIPNVIQEGNPYTDVLPTYGGMGMVWPELGSGTQLPHVNTNNSFQYAGSVTYTRGSHNIKIGTSLLRRQISSLTNMQAGGYYNFSGSDVRASWLEGTPQLELRSVQSVRPHLQSWESGSYIQDDWRVNPKFTLVLGVRYDIFTPFTEAHGQYANFDLSSLGATSFGAQNFIMGTDNSTIGVSTDHKDIAPRVGFAYSFMPSLVLRGGFGMSYFPPDVGQTSRVGAAAPSTILNNLNPPYAFAFVEVPYTDTIDDGPVAITSPDMSSWYTDKNITSVTIKPKNLRASYAEQINLFLQKEYKGNTFSAGYVGVLGRAMLRTINLDQADPPGAGGTAKDYVYQALYPTQMQYLTTMIQNYNGSITSYNSMQFLYVRRPVRGLSLSGNYTWAHALSNIGMTQTSNPSIDYGNSDTDVRHRINMNGSYSLPFGKSLSGLRAIPVKGWQMSGVYSWQTGTPFSVLAQSSETTGVMQKGVNQDRPNVTYANGPVMLSKMKDIGGALQAVNVEAFSEQTAGTFGNERVNQFYSSHVRKIDLSIMKDFTLKDRLKMQFRVECYNLTNTENFGQPQGTLSGWDSTTGYAVGAPTSNFGTVTATANGQNPRQFQYALKLSF